MTKTTAYSTRRGVHVNSTGDLRSAREGGSPGQGREAEAPGPPTPMNPVSLCLAG